MFFAMLNCATPRGARLRAALIKGMMTIIKWRCFA